ncbi:MAG: precorrin-6A reductase [Nitrospirae bacterium]|nr:precorrin-6A reductase [Nitrospirota bacterium]MBF0533662.1 precorrin-6A reductase [Nitrospirota bacterium]MBF0616687.1 precorrin-6A reductase [Nitrospirota bacterium]
MLLSNPLIYKTWKGINKNNIMETALIALNQEGAHVAGVIAAEIPASIFIKNEALPFLNGRADSHGFSKLSECLASIFNKYKRLVFIMSLGIVNRTIAPLIKDKHTDPAVVTLDESCRFVISTLSGHEGGANELTFIISSITGAEPVITTKTESDRNYIVGVGTKKGALKEDIIYAITEGCKMAGITTAKIRCIATAWAKKNEDGLLQAAEELSLHIRYIPKWMIEHYYNITPQAARSETAFKSIGVHGVSEPVAVLSGKNAQLVLPKTIFKKVTIAVAREILLFSRKSGYGLRDMVLILGGTTEGVCEAQRLDSESVPFYISTATEYGHNLFREKFGDRAVLENFNNNSLKKFIIERHIKRIIDCTHPYAQVITPLAQRVSAELDIEYIQKSRSTDVTDDLGYDKLIFVKSLDECVKKILELKIRKPLFTTGSKELGFVKQLAAYGINDVFVRVLPFENSISSCISNGVKPQNIIGMHGPFGAELNTAIIRQYGVDCLITKKTGKEGGFFEKASAAMECGIFIFVVEREG